MSRSFDMAAEYEGTVEQVHRAFGDERYWRARLAESGVDEATLDAMRRTEDGGIAVVTTQTLRADRLPAVVTQLHAGDLTFVREETWGPLADGRATAVVRGSIPDAPVNLDGEAVLAPTDVGGARLRFAASVKVRIPLVGGKVEKALGNQLVRLLIAEQRFTTRWIEDYQ